MVNNEIVLLILKVIFLWLSIFFTSINITRSYLKNEIPLANFVYQAISLTGFIFLQWIYKG